MSIKNSNDTRDIPACSAVPQPTVPPRASLSSLHRNNPLSSNNSCRKTDRMSLTAAYVQNGITSEENFLSDSERRCNTSSSGFKTGVVSLWRNSRTVSVTTCLGINCRQGAVFTPILLSFPLHPSAVHWGAQCRIYFNNPQPLWIICKELRLVK